MINVDGNVKFQSSIVYAKTLYLESTIWNLTTCNCEKVEQLTSTTKQLVIKCDKIISNADSVSTNIPTNVNKYCVNRIFITKY